MPDDSRFSTRIEEDGLTHVIRIEKPTYKTDRGKYSCEIEKIATQCHFDVEGKSCYKVIIKSNLKEEYLIIRSLKFKINCPHFPKIFKMNLTLKWMNLDILYQIWLHYYFT